jgi:hypothetical protein
VRKYARKHEVVVDGDVQFVLAIAFGDVPAGLDNIIIPHGPLHRRCISRDFAKVNLLCIPINRMVVYVKLLKCSVLSPYILKVFGGGCLCARLGGDMLNGPGMGISRADGVAKIRVKMWMPTKSSKL